MTSGYSCNSHPCRRQDLLLEKKKKNNTQTATRKKKNPITKTKPTLWTKASLHMKLGFWASQNFWRSTYVISFSLSPVLEGACLYGTMQSTCVSSAVLGDFTQCQTPGGPSAGALLTWTAFLLHFSWQGRASCQVFTLLSPPGDFTVSQQLVRLACCQVMCQIHLSHLQAEDSPMNNSERNNHLHGPFSQPQALSLTSTH